ncbi:MAG TPA: methyltransferase domain-containing protein, partial [Thermoanaerobaculia bacterium]
MDAIDRWNERYRSGELGPSHPAPVLVEAARLLPPGRALDLACGAGRNALFLVEQGWSVVAVDGSPVIVEKIRELHPRIDVLLIDLERERLPFDQASFDMVCLINFLHRPLFTETQRFIRPGGVIVSAICTVQSTMNPLYTMEIGELRSYF